MLHILEDRLFFHCCEMHLLAFSIGNPVIYPLAALMANVFRHGLVGREIRDRDTFVLCMTQFPLQVFVLSSIVLVKISALFCDA